jgi:hypothetical protein
MPLLETLRESTFRARLADAMEIWERDSSQYPQGSAAHGFVGFLLRIKASICILMDWRADDSFDVVPVWIGALYVGHDWDGPTASWSEVGVTYGWRGWTYARYQNGI